MEPKVVIDALKSSEVFQPIRVGKNKLQHKIVYAPTTRMRALDDHTPSDLNLEYYDSRTKTEGSFVVAEGTYVGLSASGYPNVPGIWTDKHVNAWKKITDQVHKNESFIGVQAWFLGRAAEPGTLKSAGQDLISPSAIYPDEESEIEAIRAKNPLRAVTAEEIHHIIHDVYGNAAKKAMEAGFDYFEIHSAHGYFVDCFLNPSSNQRTDKYGGSVENRSRFLLELIDHLSSLIGAEKIAVRFSPWANYKGLKGVNEKVHPVVTYGYVLHELQKRASAGQELAYISIVEPRVNGTVTIDKEYQSGSNDFVGHIWKGTLLKSGNYTYDAPNFQTLKRDVADKRTLVGFSRFFTSNPDFVNRIYHGHPLEPYSRSTFYSPDNWRYNTYSNHGEERIYKKDVETKKLPGEIVL